MQAIEFPGALASAAKIASRCRFKDAFAKPGRRRCRGRMGLWECGQSRPRTRNPNANANKDCPHFHGPTQKESYMKKPRRAVAVRRAPNRDRPPTAESVGSVVNPDPEPETRTQRK